MQNMVFLSGIHSFLRRTGARGSADITVTLSRSHVRGQRTVTNHHVFIDSWQNATDITNWHYKL